MQRFTIMTFLAAMSATSFLTASTSSPQSPTPNPAAASPSSVAQLDWLAGRWVREEPGQFLEETWSAPVGDALSGMFRWSREGKAWMCELMAITIEGNPPTPVFRLRHFDRTLKPREEKEPLIYPMLKMSENEVVFEDADSKPDHPRRFIYRRAGDELTVILEAADGKQDVFVFTLAGAGEAAPGAVTPSPLGFTGGMLVRFDTADRAAAVKWYREVLGFEILFEVDEIGWSELHNAEAKLTIGLSQLPEAHAKTANADASQSVIPVLGVRDIDAARQHLESKGVRFTGETHTIEGLVKLATLLDPDGHRITLYQSLGD